MLQGLEEEGRDDDDWHGTEERSPRIHPLLHKGLVNRGQTHKEAVGPTGDYAASTKCIFKTLKIHCKPRSNEIVAATAYKQLVKGEPSLPEYIEK